MHEWVTAYPNVSQLAVSDSMYYRGTRERNLRALADQCWPGLDRCDARDVADNYALGLPCCIRAVKLFDEFKFQSPQLFPETIGVCATRCIRAVLVHNVSRDLPEDRHTSRKWSPGSRAATPHRSVRG